MRFIKFNLAAVAGMIASGAMAAGQEVAPEPQSETEAAAQGEPAPAPRNQPNLPTLDDLIPQSAVEDADSWASGGAASTEEIRVSSELVAEPVDVLAEGSLDAAPSTAAPFDLDTALEQLAIPDPEPLEPDPDRPSFADIDAPDLIEVAELQEFEISDELVLAFPAEAGQFPEEGKFIDRFRALSSIETLGSDDATIPQLAARARSDEELLTQILRTYGYYNGEVVRQLSGGRRAFADQEPDDARRAEATDPKVQFDIIPGTRYRFGEVDLGELDRLQGSNGEVLRTAFGIRPGDPLYADRIVASEIDLRLALGENGFPFAEVGDPELLIDHAREEGDLTLPVAPNGQFVFSSASSSVVSSDPQFLSDRHLQRIARFDPGDLYKTSLESDLRRAVLATGLVSSVVITPREIAPPTADGPGEVALDVAMERAPLRTISGAIGYGTEDGIKVETAWEHRNLFPPEGALRLRGIVGTREQLASVTYRRNNFRDRDQVLTVDTYVSDIETEAVDARTVALRTSFERISNLLFQKPLSWQVGAEVLYTDERNRVTNGISRPRQTYLIAGLFGSATLDSSDDLLDPRNGYRLTGFLAPEASRSLGAQSFYLRNQLDASYYKDVGRAVIAGRTRVATIQGANLADIAPSRRLYAGGGGSVRGYGFQSIGPRDQFDEPLGGRSLVEFALEARVQTGLLDSAVEIVPFIDAGSVSTSTTPDFSSIQYGAGLGVRYKTSFGPIRVDVGVPLNPTQFDAPVVVYVSLGQAF